MPIDATLPNAESRACTRGIKSGSGSPLTCPCGCCACTLSRTSRRIASSSAVSTARSPRPRPGGGYERRQTAARRELSNHRRLDGLGGLHDVAQHAVDDILLENAQIAEREQVHFVRLQLEAEAVGHIAEHQLAEIRQPGLRADRGELRHHNLDFVIGILVRPGLDLRQLRVHSRRRVFVGVAAFHASAFDSRSRNSPTSATTPTACPVPRSLTFVATAGLMSTHTIFTQLGSMLPVAMECSIVPMHSTRPAPFNCSAYASWAQFMSVMVSGSGPSSRRLPASTNGTFAFTHSYRMPEFSLPDSTAARTEPA